MENREFTTKQIANILGVHDKVVDYYKRKLGIPGRRVKTGKLMECYFTYPEYTRIVSVIRAESKLFTKKPEVVKVVNKSLEELKKEHPLVTDERCFRLSWWPDVTPKGYSDEELQD